MGRSLSCPEATLLCLELPGLLETVLGGTNQMLSLGLCICKGFRMAQSKWDGSKPGGIWVCWGWGDARGRLRG